MESNDGNNANQRYVSDPATTKAQLEAQIAEGAKLLAPLVAGQPAQAPAMVSATATEPAPAQTPATPPATPAEGTKVDSLQQFRGKDGEVDLSKIEKSNEHLEKITGTREERLAQLLATNKELRRKHVKVSQELKAAEQGSVNAAPVDVTTGAISPELKKKILEDLERDPAETILRLTETAIKNRLQPFEAERMRMAEESSEKRFLEDLDHVGQQGHHWVYTDEGRQRFDSFFAANPWVLQAPNPYSTAIKLMGFSTGGVSGPAQTVPRPPTLGSFHAAPPPTTASPATPEAELPQLGRALENALSIGDMKSAQMIRLKLDALHRQLMPERM
jgi:hypothetical protein